MQYQRLRMATATNTCSDDVPTGTPESAAVVQMEQTATDGAACSVVVLRPAAGPVGRAAGQ